MGNDTPGPLTETVFYVLLALHTPMHGYGIMQFAQEVTGGRVTIGAGTLYGALTTLTEKGWIIPLAGDEGDRRKEYVVSEWGHTAFVNEMARLQELLGNGQRVFEGGRS